MSSRVGAQPAQIVGFHRSREPKLGGDRLFLSTGAVRLHGDVVSRCTDSLSRCVDSVGRRSDSAGRCVDSLGRRADSVSRCVDSVGRRVDSVGRRSDSVSRCADWVYRRADSVGRGPDRRLRDGNGAQIGSPSVKTGGRSLQRRPDTVQWLKTTQQREMWAPKSGARCFVWSRLRPDLSRLSAQRPDPGSGRRPAPAPTPPP
jgi:hypothetical protein